MLSDDSEGWDSGVDGRQAQREKIYVYLSLNHIVVQQKLAQHCKAITCAQLLSHV